ncbi:potassium-transporting ATPase subunit F [Streptomyces sp. NPDC057403]
MVGHIVGAIVAICVAGYLVLAVKFPERF